MCSVLNLRKSRKKIELKLSDPMTGTCESTKTGRTFDVSPSSAVEFLVIRTPTNKQALGAC